MEMLEEGQNQPKIGPKRIKLEEIEEKGEVDRLSALPDCLLLEILSRLPLTEDAINTCFISSPTGAISWKNLRSLSISKGRFDEDLIENILSGSPVLETLVLNECYGFKRLDITSKSLKNLVLSGYDRYDIDIAAVIEINAPNISSLTIQDELNLWELLLLDVTSLIEAKLDYWNYGKIARKVQDKMLKGFIVNLCHVKELKIGPGCGRVLSRLEDKGFDLPSNIKFLDGAISQMEQGDSSAGFDSDYQYESDEDN